MEEKLLSISEAAKLLSVCENTLRDWDIEGKFTAVRTAGGHRRYDLDKIREHLDKNLKIEDRDNPTTQEQEKERLLYEFRDYLPNVWPRAEQEVLAQLLKNQRDYWTSGFQNDSTVLSTNQTLLLVSEAWKRSKLRKMINVNVMEKPVGLIPYATQKEKSLTISAEAIAAKTYKYDFRIFHNAKFDSIKNTYADTLALEIDIDIRKHLPKLHIDMDIMTQHDLSGFNYDYVVGPENTLKYLKSHWKNNGINFIEMPTIIDEASFLPMMNAGKYPDKWDMPVFCPYILFMEGPYFANMTHSILFRAGWFEDPNKTEKKSLV